MIQSCALFEFGTMIGQPESLLFDGVLFRVNVSWTATAQAVTVDAGALIGPLLHVIVSALLLLQALMLPATVRASVDAVPVAVMSPLGFHVLL